MIMNGTDFAVITVEIRDGKETNHEKALDGRHPGDGDPGFGRKKCFCP
jgi:hypothetical protein